MYRKHWPLGGPVIGGLFALILAFSATSTTASADTEVNFEKFGVVFTLQGSWERLGGGANDTAAQWAYRQGSVSAYLMSGKHEGLPGGSPSQEALDEVVKINIFKGHYARGQRYDVLEKRMEIKEFPDMTRILAVYQLQINNNKREFRAALLFPKQGDVWGLIAFGNYQTYESLEERFNAALGASSVAGISQLGAR